MKEGTPYLRVSAFEGDETLNMQVAAVFIDLLYMLPKRGVSSLRDSSDGLLTLASAFPYRCRKAAKVDWV